MRVSKRSGWITGCFMVALVPAGLPASPEPVPSNWGIDACITRHVEAEALPAYLQLLGASSIRLVRERGVKERRRDGTSEADARDKFLQLKRAGLSVVAFATLPAQEKPEQAGNALVEDLRAVYDQGRTLGCDYHGLVDAWEMVGEADLGYCTDLPDRVAAYQKALYLGIKAGSREQGAKSPIVLMGAVGCPPGPWLERAARNGLLDYTDGYNFHFYGNAEDLTNEIKAHRAFAAQWGRRGVPLWITECGINAVAPGDLLNPARRQLQADFTVSTARQALKAKDVAVFMPFILVHEGDPHAMTLAADKPLPAWTAYAEFTRKNPWPKRTMAAAPADPNPLVVQWLPDNQTTTPHKVSGTYRFKEGQPIKGELRLFNFSDKPIRGRLEHGAGSRELGVRINLDNDHLEIPAMGMKTIPLEFVANSKGYFREEWAAGFVDLAGRRSPVGFGLEQSPREQDFNALPVVLHPVSQEKIRHPLYPLYTVTSQSGPWIGINGLNVGEAGSEEPGAKSGELKAWVEKVGDDPLFPPMAVARVAGLPGRSFLRLQLDRPMSRTEKVRADLVDDLGRRFTIWENFGVGYYENSTEVWLNLADFHNYSWGKTTNDPSFHPERVQEVQLRFYLTKVNEPMRVKFAFMQAKGAESGARSEAK